MAGLDDISNRVRQGIQRAMKEGQKAKAGAEDNIQALVQAQLNKLDVVTREEFEAQRTLLRKTQQQVTQLEAELEQLKKQP
ncbi:MAG: accessory factor UbiK family protein [Natronospirillum sp.]